MDLPKYIDKECKKHGLTSFALEGRGYYRCKACRVQNVSNRRKKVKRILVEEAGGSCQRCGYNRCLEALQFHHRDPSIKKFGLSAKGATRGISELRKEAAKCDLLCANCHVEVEYIRE